MARPKHADLGKEARTERVQVMLTPSQLIKLKELQQEISGLGATSASASTIMASSLDFYYAYQLEGIIPKDISAVWQRRQTKADAAFFEQDDKLRGQGL
jgi:hypothetical protein